MDSMKHVQDLYNYEISHILSSSVPCSLMPSPPFCTYTDERACDMTYVPRGLQHASGTQ